MILTENFEEFLKMTPEIFSNTLDKAESERKIKNPKRNDKKMGSYCKAISNLKDFLRNGRGTATFDSPYHFYSYHICTIHIDNDEFDSSEIKQFTEILNLFDNMMITGDSNGNISFMLMMENIYEEKS